MAKKKPSAKSTRARTTRKTARSTKPAKKSPKKKASRENAPAKAAGVGETEEPGGELVTMDRRRRSDRRTDSVSSGPAEAGPSTAKTPKLERRKKVTRRRQIDPTTCERDYNEAEIEFMNALDDYKRKSGRMFPTCSEVLEVIRDLGYVRLSPSELAASPPNDHPRATESLPASTESATAQLPTLTDAAGG